MTSPTPNLGASMNASRNCIRCGKELTDAASLLAGIGPVCRKLDNAILARLIPSDVVAAVAAWAAINIAALPSAVVKTLGEVYAALTASDAGTRLDWRVEIKRIEWILSHDASQLEAFAKVVGALGYLPLVALWYGDAAKGKASVDTFMDGTWLRIMVYGPKNAGARKAFKNIPGYRFHPKDSTGSKAGWSFPAKQIAQVQRAFATHYPNHDAVEASEVFAKANTWNAAQIAATPVAVAAPRVTITKAGGWLSIKSPYNPNFVSALKAEVEKMGSYRDRKWNGTEKAWEVAEKHEMLVKGLIVTFYGLNALA